MTIQAQLDNLLKNARTSELKKNGSIDYDENIDILLEAKYLRLISNGNFKITNKGKIYIKNGGYGGEIRRNSISKSLQYGFWLANILGLFITIGSLKSIADKSSKQELNFIIYQDTFHNNLIYNIKSVSHIDSLSLKNKSIP